jgi:hypothetical protein
MPQAQVVSGERIADQVTGLFHRNRRERRPEDRLLDAVDAQVDRADPACQRPRECRLAAARQTAEDDQHDRPHLPLSGPEAVAGNAAPFKIPAPV